MGRHVVRAFAGMNEVRILRAQLVRSGLKIYSHIGVCVFIDGQTGGCVLNKHVQNSNPNITQFGKLRQNILRDQMKPSSVWC